MDSIIFDLDGTLWDACKTLTKPWTETLNNHGVNKILTHSDLASIMGMDVSGIAKTFMPELDEKTRVEIAYKACNAEIPYLKKFGGTLYPELESTLNTLSQKYKLFIVSNCEEDYINAFWDFHGLKKYFTDAEYIGRTGKPKADNIKIIIDRHALKSPVYVGDTEMDMKASNANNIPFIFASYGFGKCENYVAKLNKISDLPKITENL